MHNFWSHKLLLRSWTSAKTLPGVQTVNRRCWATWRCRCPRTCDPPGAPGKQQRAQPAEKLLQESFLFIKCVPLFEHQASTVKVKVFPSFWAPLCSLSSTSWLNRVWEFGRDETNSVTNRQTVFSQLNRRAERPSNHWVLIKTSPQQVFVGGLSCALIWCVYIYICVWLCVCVLIDWSKGLQLLQISSLQPPNS